MFIELQSIGNFLRFVVRLWHWLDKPIHLQDVSMLYNYISFYSIAESVIFRVRPGVIFTCWSYQPARY